MSEELEARSLAAARVWAAHKFPYLASALFATTVVPTSSVDVAAVDDKWRLYVNPETATSWTVEEFGSLLIHHVGHLVREHADRARSMGVSEATAHDWTRACDAELNDDLAEVGVRPPGDATMPEDLGAERGRMAEEYFGLAAADEADDHGDDHDDHGSGVDGLPRDWDEGGDRQGGLTEHEAALVRRRVAEAIEQAARERGDVPGGWKRWARTILDPKVDWRRTLAAEIRRSVNRQTGRVDYSYRRPSRRASASPDIVLPAMEHPVPDIAVVVDTSASMGDDQLERVMAEIDGLLRGIGVRSGGITVLAVDVDVQARSRVTAARNVELSGGGGTDMGRGIEAAEQLRPRPAVVVVLTDGYTPWPDRPPKAMAVVVALLAAPGRQWPAPSWARVVVIDDAA